MSQRLLFIQPLHFQAGTVFPPSTTLLTPALTHSRCSVALTLHRLHPSLLILFHCNIRTTAFFRRYVLMSSVLPPSTATISAGKLKLLLHAQRHSLTLLRPSDTLSRSGSTFSRSYCYAMHAVKALHFYVSMPSLIHCALFSRCLC